MFFQVDFFTVLRIIQKHKINEQNHIVPYRTGLVIISDIMLHIPGNRHIQLSDLKQGCLQMPVCCLLVSLGQAEHHIFP